MEVHVEVHMEARIEVHMEERMKVQMEAHMELHMDYETNAFSSRKMSPACPATRTSSNTCIISAAANRPLPF